MVEGSGYHRQARVENGFFRYRSVLGGQLKARNGKAQGREAAIGCHILNRMAALGKPKLRRSEVMNGGPASGSNSRPNAIVQQRPHAMQD